MLHLLALVAVAIAAIPVFAKPLLAVALIASLIYQLRDSKHQTQLVWRTGNRWFIDADQHPSRLVAINFFSRWLVILSLQPEKPDTDSLTSPLLRRQKFVLPFDSLDEDTFRLLRVRLRIEGFEMLNPSDETS